MTTSTLIITLAGPMQYWAAAAGPRQKRTHDHPTKTAVTGLIANALGRDYTDPIDDIADLAFATTAVRPGTVELDYKTAGTVTYPALPGDLIAGIKLDGTDAAGRRQIASSPRKNPDWNSVVKGSANVPKADYKDKPTPGVQIWEEYLADAEYRVALTGDTTLLTQIHHSLAHPARGIFLGRKAYTPAKPLVGPDSLHDGHLADNMDAFDTGGTLWAETRPGTPGSHLIDDQPVTFNGGSRRRKRAEIIRRPDNTPTSDDVSHADAPDLFATALE
jgi:CRISPR system Cascade subunit CasD